MFESRINTYYEDYDLQELRRRHTRATSFCDDQFMRTRANLRHSPITRVHQSRIHLSSTTYATPKLPLQNKVNPRDDTYWLATTGE